MAKKKEAKKDLENKKEIEKQEEIQKGIMQKRIQNKQIRWAVFMMAALLIIIVAIPLIIKMNNKFTYINLKWEKTKLGDLKFFSTKIPVTTTTNAATGSVTQNNYVTGYYTMPYFRSDPRKINDINVSLYEPGKIKFKQAGKVYITLEPGNNECEEDIVALANLAGFLSGFGGLTAKSAFNDKEYATASKFPYVTCNNTPDNTVIVVQSGNQSSIMQKAENCYEMTFKDCDLMKVSEKFILIMLEEYMKKFKLK